MWVNTFIYIAVFLLIPYCILILFYRKWFRQLKPFVANPKHIPSIYFSIIIPARNEAENIGNCLLSILNQNYSTNLFEIIVVDDHSTDNTALIVSQFKATHNNIVLIKLADELQGKKLNAYKKKAIDTAIQQAKGSWIITTDADCIAPKNWLFLFDQYIKKNNSLFVAAPVMFTTNKSIISKFQYIDFMALQAATAAAVSVGFHSMCNGANLAYNKQAFFNVNGFKGIDNIASGDDMLLMNKIKATYPKQIGYLFTSDAIVLTAPMPNWTSFLNQRIRWASKADKYQDKSLLPVLFAVYLFNLSLFLMFFAGLIYWKLLAAWFVLLFIKTMVEWFYINIAARFFGKLNWLEFAALQPLHITYMVVAGWLGKFGNYKWKDRNVS